MYACARARVSNPFSFWDRMYDNITITLETKRRRVDEEKKIYRERYKIYLCTIMRHIRVALKLSLIRVIYTTRVC